MENNWQSYYTTEIFNQQALDALEHEVKKTCEEVANIDSIKSTDIEIYASELEINLGQLKEILDNGSDKEGKFEEVPIDEVVNAISTRINELDEQVPNMSHSELDKIIQELLPY